jgi:hypothetical protein
VLAAAEAPVGAWEAKDDCFLAAFVVLPGGHARMLYRSGESDEDAAWTWDGAALRITSKVFPLDRFTARLKGTQVEADYTWHELKKDELHPQACVFEKFAAGRGA